MTKLILNLCIISLLAINTTQANNDKTTPNSAENKTLTVSFEGWNTEFVEVRFFDNAGTQLFVEKMNAKDVAAKRYNFKELSTGTYKLEISDNVKTAERKIKFDENGILMTEENNVIYKPFFVKKDDKVLINQLILGNAAKLQIRDEANNVLHEEYVVGKNTLAKTFNVAKLPAGHYSFVIQTQGKSFQKTFYL